VINRFTLCASVQVAAMMGSALHIVFGPDIEQLMTPSDAMYSVFKGIASDAAADQVEVTTSFLFKEGMGRPLSNPARQGLAWILLILRPLFFRFLMVGACCFVLLCSR